MSRIDDVTSVFQFSDHPEDGGFGFQGRLLFVPSHVASKEQLLERFARGLGFPDYFGHNWDALSDCLRDLTWLQERDVLIVHEGLPEELTTVDLRKYLSVLLRVATDWKREEAHAIRVLFPSSSRAHVERILAGDT